jgi:hypothetical protein
MDPRKLARYRHTILLVLLLLVLAAFWALIVNERNQCRDDGGDYVRGLLWYECVGEGTDE